MVSVVRVFFRVFYIYLRQLSFSPLSFLALFSLTLSLILKSINRSIDLSAHINRHQFSQRLRLRLSLNLGLMRALGLLYRKHAPEHGD